MADQTSREQKMVAIVKNVVYPGYVIEDAGRNPVFTRAIHNPLSIELIQTLSKPV